MTGLTALTERGTAGATVTAGQPVYVDAADGNSLKPADANASATTAAAVGIALHAALDGQPLEYITAGPLALGAILTQGLWYVVSATAGGICPTADLASTHFSTLLGYAHSTSVLVVVVKASGVALA